MSMSENQSSASLLLKRLGKQQAAQPPPRHVQRGYQGIQPLPRRIIQANRHQVGIHLPWWATSRATCRFSGHTVKCTPLLRQCQVFSGIPLTPAEYQCTVNACDEELSPRRSNRPGSWP